MARRDRTRTPTPSWDRWCQSGTVVREAGLEGQDGVNSVTVGLEVMTRVAQGAEAPKMWLGARAVHRMELRLQPSLTRTPASPSVPLGLVGGCGLDMRPNEAPADRVAATRSSTSRRVTGRRHRCNRGRLTDGGVAGDVQEGLAIDHIRRSAVEAGLLLIQLSVKHRGVESGLGRKTVAWPDLRLAAPYAPQNDADACDHHAPPVHGPQSSGGHSRIATGAHLERSTVRL